MPLHWLERTWIKLPGIVLLLVSLLWTLLGLFLMIPNVGTLIALLVGIILIGIQVRLEEEYLTSTHGDTYIEYRRKRPQMDIANGRFQN
jgi:protein-S-isoprenylcysteine O-methyltransferase Ste14